MCDLVGLLAAGMWSGQNDERATNGSETVTSMWNRELILFAWWSRSILTMSYSSAVAGSSRHRTPALTPLQAGWAEDVGVLTARHPARPDARTCR